MIKIKVINSINSDQIGDFVFNKNQIVFSTKEEADFILKKKVIFSLSVNQSGLFLLSPDSNDKMTINNKYASELNKLKVNDSLKIEEYEFVVTDFSLSTILNLRQTLNSNTQKIIEQKGEALSLMNKIKSGAQNV